MDRRGALAQLDSGNARERLEAARFLHAHATQDDRSEMLRILRTESDHRVIAELDAAVAALAPDRLGGEDQDEGDARQASIETVSRAVKEATSMLVHEIRQVLPPLTHAAEQEIGGFTDSQTAGFITRLDDKVAAIESLGSAASTPVIKDFDLAELVAEVIDAECDGTNVTVEKIGRSPMLVYGDRKLINLALCQGLRNAIEASAGHNTGSSSIVVTWDDAASYYWVVVLDRGVGLPVGSNHAFDIGRTSKPKRDHHGMGLPIAKQAIDSLEGQISLKPRSDRGAAFEIRWPKP